MKDGADRSVVPVAIARHLSISWGKPYPVTLAISLDATEKNVTGPNLY